MKWELPLQEGILLNRYKRFLADVVLDDKTHVAHVPNTGSMTSCWEPNWKCALSVSNNPKRKLAHTLELTHNGESWIGVNTGNANKLVQEWLQNKLLPPFAQYSTITPEKKIFDSRIDFYLEEEDLPACYIEVKSVTLKRDGMAQFPDAVSTRGQKHLKDLIEIKKSGLRAAMVYVVQREDVEVMGPAHAIDPQYGKFLKEAVLAGVEIFVYQCKIDLNEIKFGRPLAFNLE